MLDVRYNEIIMTTQKFVEASTAEQSRRLQSLADALKAAAHPIRLEIMQLLADQAVSVGGLQDQLEVPQSVVSHHLAYLRRAHIVTRTRRGTAMMYELADHRLDTLLEGV